MSTPLSNPSLDPFYGETTCQHKNCTNHAYWKVENLFLCGVHSRNKEKITLLKNPNASKQRQQTNAERDKLVLDYQRRNQEAKREGVVICSKLRMMRTPEYVEGFRKVYPNYKHEKKKDGFGCMSLSPKALGPVIHHQPGLPDALNLENYHQSNKCFPWELDEKQNPTKEFYDLQRARYLDPTPYRHKFDPEYLRARGLTNLNIPAYSVHLTTSGEEKHFTYVQSRYFYCKQYELLASQTDAYCKLINLKRSGMNLQIVGYDAYPITKDLYEHYLDDSKPFGHELVLFSLLTVDNPKNFPWNRYRKENASVYEGIYEW